MSQLIFVIFALGLLGFIIIILFVVLALSKKTQSRPTQNNGGYQMHNMQGTVPKHVVLEDIDRLTHLKESGVLTEEEYQHKKKMLLEKL